MNDANPRPIAGRDWLLYALFDLTAPTSGDLISAQQLESRLQIALEPLGLTAEFLRRVQATVTASLDFIPPGTIQARVLVFTPSAHLPQGKTWGYFRTLKSGASPNSGQGGWYEIALYLYSEGAAAV